MRENWSFSTKPLSPSDHLSPPNCLYDEPTSLTTCPSASYCLTITMTCLTVCPSSTTIQRTQDSSQSLAVMNGSNRARPRNSVGPLLTMTYFYVPWMHLASIQVTLDA